MNTTLYDILETWKPEGAKTSDVVLDYPCFGGTLGNGNRDLHVLMDWCGVQKHGSTPSGITSVRSWSRPGWPGDGKIS